MTIGTDLDWRTFWPFGLCVIEKLRTVLLRSSIPLLLPLRRHINEVEGGGIIARRERNGD